MKVLLCDLFPGQLPADVTCYFSLFKNLFASAGGECEYEVFHAFQNRFPAVIDPDAVYLIPGSNAGVYEDIDWVRNLLGFIRYADSQGAKMAGVCFGHQAIAQALGGKVVRSEKGWGVGVRRSEVVDLSTREYFPDGVMKLHCNHRDQVVELPSEAVLTARSGFCPVEGFRLGERIVTFQGHPEYTDAFGMHLLENFSKGEPRHTVDSAVRMIREERHTGVAAARRILSL